MRFGDLDPATDSALQALAAQYPELFVYDSETGMLRFKSDLTFDSGSDVVKSEARSALGQLATILNGPAAQYDIRVVGHTDAQRVRQVAGRRFKDNLELSAFRSISVRNVLVGAGVAATRVEFAGRGEFDPIVPNTAGSGNTQENRRVEMFLVRPLRRGVPAPSGDMGGGDAPSAPAPKEEFMK
jgi:chemotaxis protein MotB